MSEVRHIAALDRETYERQKWVDGCRRASSSTGTIDVWYGASMT